MLVQLNQTTEIVCDGSCCFLLIVTFKESLEMWGKKIKILTINYKWIWSPCLPGIIKLSIRIVILLGKKHQAFCPFNESGDQNNMDPSLCGPKKKKHFLKCLLWCTGEEENHTGLEQHKSE